MPTPLDTLADRERNYKKAIRLNNAYRLAANDFLNQLEGGLYQANNFNNVVQRGKALEPKAYSTQLQGISPLAVNTPQSIFDSARANIPVSVDDVLTSAKKDTPVEINPNPDFTGYPRPAYTFSEPVDINALEQGIIDRSGVNGTEPVISPKYDRPDYTKSKSLLGLDELAKAIMAGEFGNGTMRRQRLINAGYTPEEITNAQKLVNQTMAKPVTRTRTVARRNVDSVITKPTVTNVPVQSVNTYAPSGYAIGHEAYYDPVSGQLKFR